MAERRDDEREAAGDREVERLRRENALLSALLESASDLVDVLAADGTIVRTFRARGRPLGYEPQELAGRNVIELLHPEDMPIARTARARLLHDGEPLVRVELRLKRRDGTWVPVECMLENRLADPAVGGIVVCSRDVSARLELERELRLAQRMESVGRVASGIVHDFNNLLAVLRLGAERALAALDDGALPRARGALSEIVRGAELGASLTKRLLSFVRARPFRPRLVDLGALVAAQHGTLQSLLPDDVRLELSPPAEPLLVIVDPAELEHVLLNLVLNARDAMPCGGTVRVLTRSELAPGGPGRALLEIRDEGVGMDELTSARSFEPFFTTKPVERGTGLGLWTVQNVITRAGGAVELQSVPGQGTVVRVWLPLAHDAATAARGASEPSPEIPRLCILLVDDEVRLLELLSAALRDAGHEVHTARDGAEAVELVGGGLRPDVLVSDLSMPRLGGLQLARRLREILPELPVLLVSGYGEAEAAPVDARTALLAKPFAVEELLAAIAALVSSEP